MCGICGELRLDGRAVAPELIEHMLPALQRRGPDDAGTWHSGRVALGHRRLSIIDLSNRSHQPMVDAELSLVFNGAIYNYRELRADLQARGHVFVSGGDTEVILKAYREWGVDCPSHLHGMFAFAIWDGRRQCLFAARDRFGIKPFYYALDDNRFRFASNTQALLAGGGIDTAIDPVGLHFQYTLHAVIPAPHTILRGIRKLEPAHSLQLDANGTQTLRRYWNLDATRLAEPRSEQEWVDATHEALLAAVRKRNDVADVPVGVLLSGGLDSSLLVALLAEIGVRDFHTFSVGFEDQPEEKGSEFEFSDQVVERYRPVHHKFLVPNDQVLKRLPEAVDAMAEPMFGQDAVAFYLLSEQVSKSIKVVQSGQGADEVFGGYFWYPRMLAERDGTRLERFRKHYFDRDHPEFLRMVTPPYRGADHTGEFVASRLDDALSDDFLDAVLKLDVTTLIVDDPVKRVDNMTMAWGLEARVPFLDHHLVEVAARCPVGLKLQSDGKHLLKRIARGIVPDAVIDRPKGYFPMPALKYVRGPFLDFMRSILDSRACRERGLFDRGYVDNLLAAPEMHHTRIMGSKLWHLALLEFWLQRNVDGTA
ncbi:MAG: N-acetylglutaminylglutamine amidotransferase [Chromatiaceae bacterium]|nr:N-acetylglutaminylglutamine amidotransferase [Gammaproteobacteria bacterium]MCP5318755.1 N-acetylglutaminylglutamine amidotransferase [Chromatiaceae bacterium]MCP5435556.1 N-acetylglutaminylglutamine amidotransferase [Chromatiaceae bacterium]HOP16323.1 N-acetylglutaminylglutamine amidotransferase [Gammaproteobacteria bacterium]HPQ25342.1 N-acetylglutaminylglutamine amidotransferase [Gammaproteobacteria bacterium]